MDYTDFPAFLKRRRIRYSVNMDEPMEKRTAPQERAPYNLRTNFDATVRAMAEVEKGGWLNSNRRTAEHWDETSESDRAVSLEAARRWLAEVDPVEDWQRTVYGDGGDNRWFVRADGSVWFSKFHASREGLQRAQDRGFQIE